MKFTVSIQYTVHTALNENPSISYSKESFKKGGQSVGNANIVKSIKVFFTIKKLIFQKKMALFFNINHPKFICGLSVFTQKLLTTCFFCIAYIQT